MLAYLKKFSEKKDKKVQEMADLRVAMDINGPQDGKGDDGFGFAHGEIQFDIWGKEEG